jgi:hypothetical protein
VAVARRDIAGHAEQSVFWLRQYYQQLSSLLKFFHLGENEHIHAKKEVGLAKLLEFEA